MVNTSFMMGGALGLAVLASLAAARTQHEALLGAAAGQALNAGYHLAFGAGAAFVILAALVGVAMFTKGAQGAHSAAPTTPVAPH
jgi:hypothetical protein